MQVDESNIGRCSNPTDGFLNGFMPVAGTTLEARMTMEDGCHQAYPDFRLRIGYAERVDECTVVTDEFIAVIRPVARIGVVQSEVDNHPVGLEVKGLPIFRQLPVWLMTMPKQRCTGMAEVLDFILIAQQLLQDDRIGGMLTVVQSVAICHAVTNTGNTQLALCRHRECDKEQA